MTFNVVGDVASTLDTIKDIAKAPTAAMKIGKTSFFTLIPLLEFKLAVNRTDF
jgi:hypothetical protein